ncbi:siderophore ABC transporter substrate-binding protein [Delftia tsuruhatensis]|nr:siderophore ABC transporter substrate-binding protein [Delftia tsuruhatensis]MCO5337680.1 siderophore ABC transporter substrate-binding protein [Delftia tsuruhatensis]MCR4543320.1 siderophore ABC transporter substrate-binding protein [Delftia tsuruhatensis]
MFELPGDTAIIERMNTLNANHSRRHILATMGQGAGMLVTLPLALSMAHAQTAAVGKTVTVPHAKGEVQVPFKPVRVLVFELAALDTLQALGGEVRGVPEFKMPPLLARYADARYARIGSLFEPDYEAVKALSPDLIIVGGRSEAKYKELSRFAPVLDLSVSDQHQMADIYRNIRTLGAVYGLQDKAEAEVRAVEQAIAALHGKAQDAGKGLVLLTSGGKLSAYGPGSRFGMLHDVFGVKPAIDNLTVARHGQVVSFEFLLKTNPDWLFVIDRDVAIGQDGKTAQQLLDNPLVRATKAWRGKQVVYLNAANWYTLSNAGPGALKANIQQLSDAFTRT